MNGSGQRAGPVFTEACLFTAGNVQREPSLNWLVWFLNSQQISIFFPCKCQEVKRNSESDDHEKSAHKPEKLQEIKDNRCSFVFWKVLQEILGLAVDQEEETLSYLLICEKCVAVGSV